MLNKNPKQKKKKMKTIIVKVPKAKPFDLSFSDTKENIKILTAIEGLKANPGWQFLTQVFEANLKDLSDQIISKRDRETKKVLTDEEVDILRYKYSYLTELMEKPDAFIKQLRRTEDIEEDNDPYYK